MALRDKRTNNLIELWCLVSSGGLDISVSSTSFQNDKKKLDLNIKTTDLSNFDKQWLDVSFLSYCYCSWQKDWPLCWISMKRDRRKWGVELAPILFIFYFLFFSPLLKWGHLFTLVNEQFFCGVLNNQRQVK